MRNRLVLLVIAMVSLVLVAFLIPFALLVRSSAADRAISASIVELEALVPLVATVDTGTLQLSVDQMNASGRHKITIFLPGGQRIGVPVAETAAVRQARAGNSLTVSAPEGQEIVVAVAGLSNGNGTAVIRSFVSETELRRGVTHAWMIIIMLGLGLLAVSALVAHLLARSMTRPLTAVADVSYQLAKGDLAARAPADGPAEVRQVSAGLNLLAARIGELLETERERVADLSHRLRTPLTALRIDVESMGSREDQARLTADLDAVERTVDAIIHAARRPVRHEVTATCDAVRVVADRAAFWSVLAEEEGRPMEVVLGHGPLMVRADQDDLADCVDALLGNAFTHTPEGCAIGLRLAPLPGGGAELLMIDNGPGLPDNLMLERGRSGSGSTGLGLDIARRVATGSGGSLRFGRSPIGGAMIVLHLGGLPPIERRRNRHRGPARGGRRLLRRSRNRSQGPARDRSWEPGRSWHQDLSWDPDQQAGRDQPREQPRPGPRDGTQPGGDRSWGHDSSWDHGDRATIR